MWQKMLPIDAVAPVILHSVCTKSRLQKKQELGLKGSSLITRNEKSSGQLTVIYVWDLTGLQLVFC